MEEAKMGELTEDGRARWELWICETCGARLTDTPNVLDGAMATPVDPKERALKVHRIVCEHQKVAHGKGCQGHRMPRQEAAPAASTRKLELRVLAPESLGDATPIPVEVVKLEVEAGRKAFVFVVRGSDVDAMRSKDSLRNLGQILGDLAHPAQCALYVCPENMKLEIHEVVDQEEERAEKN